MPKQASSNRRNIVLGIIFVIGLTLLARLFQVQVLDDRYEAFAEQNVLSKRVDYPSRGLMYDRDGRLLVSNEAIYDLMIVPSKAREADARALARLLGISAEEYRERFSEAAAYSQVKPSVFYKQLSKSRYGRFQEQMFRFPGFFVQVRTKRQYHYAIAPHVLGYLGEVNRREMERDEYYGLGDYRGKAGLELAYEEALRGQKGVRHILVDVFNREQGTYEDGEMDIPPQAGYDLQLTLDAELQAYGERLMQNKRGAVVAIEPKTGEVLSMVSSPSYDPRRLTGRQRGKEYRKLVRDTFNIPMLNRAVSSQYPPGSTVKPLQALVAMEDSVIVPSTHFGCRLGYHIRGLSVGCHSHPSPLDVRGSIQHSCNAYYCHVFQKYLSPSRFGSTDSAFNRWREQVQGFGFGQRLGLDLPNVDKAGGIPPASLYNNIYGKGRWRASTIISLAIGQGEFQASVAQLANYTATIANRGYYITPHLVSEIGPRPKTRGIDTFQAPVARRHFIPVVEGMYAVVDRGTARFYGKVPDMNICGKTGTSQNPHGEDHSVFVAFAPKDDPQIAIAALVENAGYGGTWAAPISTMMIEQYLNGKIHPKRKWIEKRVLEGDFIKRPEEESADSTQTASLTDAE